MAKTKKKYTIKVKMNGLDFLKRNSSIAEALYQIKPETLYTEVYITVKDGDFIAERRLTLIQGKKLFSDEQFL